MLYYLIQHALRNMNTNAYRNLIHEQGDRPPAAGGPPPMRIPGAARRTSSQLSKTMTLCSRIAFSVLLFRAT